MLRRTAVSLVLLALLAAIGFFLSRDSFREPLSDTNESPGTEDKHGSDPSPKTHDAAGRLRSEPAVPPSAGPEMAANKRMAAVVPNLAESPSIQKMLADSDPRAKSLFQSALQSVERGDFAKARTMLHEILADYGWECNKNRMAAPAYWAIGLTYYQEGGQDGLSLAATFFQNYQQTYPTCEPKELLEAAQINLSVIYMDQMNTAAKENARTRAAQHAADALKAYLEKWPDSPEAYAAGLSYAYVQAYLANVP
jgi:hypothetical protein